MAEMLRPFVVKFVARVLLLLLMYVAALVDRQCCGSCYYEGKQNKKVVESIHSRNKESTGTKTDEGQAKKKTTPDRVDVSNTEIKSLVLGS
ncbi:hypothetical protein BDB00DRAFT_854096 [Zychaea mexicana]|uniref:uncharacterized protein n=1 Tax=Zychaea mexicana TaxID=64656 RepID=UPI0022FEC03D|nr:uncharacterized protein BDB00DRAFT_854096 [Zychaea mexicana]KAI9484678.1 hypothetical protein BDB00DRAFT_854096 [Zychaea mexicana]